MTERTFHRYIVERWVITGTLRLETPAHFGSGDADALTDMPLLLDEASGRPLLPGTSIAGALRNYLRELELGYGVAEGPGLNASLLFGGARLTEDGEQSVLIVHDALGTPVGVELRDGVAIDSDSRTALDEKKFDLQLLSAGCTFGLRFELLFCEGQDPATLASTLATALNGLNGEIALGVRKARGYGQCKAENWEVRKYKLGDPKQLLDWLSSERGWKTQYQVIPLTGKPIQELLGHPIMTGDERSQVRLTAEFELDGTLLIRSGFGEADSGPDTVHVHTKHKSSGKRVPVIPGTSWAGVLRHRALKIARTLSNNRQAVDEKGVLLTKNNKRDPLLDAEIFVNDLFGPSEIKPEDKNVHSSRVSICETEIKKPDALVITRVKIDRFTGGALDSALFSEQPAVGNTETRVTLDLSLRQYIKEENKAEIGLLLLVLKDLWTGDLTIGGESGIGRGRLKGKKAQITFNNKNEWIFTAMDDQGGISLKKNGPKAENVQDFVDAFCTRMQNGGGK